MDEEVIESNWFTKIKNSLYILIPIASIGLYALFYLYQQNFTMRGEGDFENYYKFGIQLIKDPANFYDVFGNFFSPCRACIYAVTFCLLPLPIAGSIHYVLMFIFGILYVIEFDKILILLDLKDKLHRFFFLIVISNSWFIYKIFAFNSERFVIGFIIFYIIRRELQFNREKKEKNLKYYIVNYGVFIYMIGIAPYFVFFLIIYIFHGINYRDLFKKNNIKNYFIIIAWFLIQNFLFIFYPFFILEFLKGIFWAEQMNALTKVPIMYLSEFLYLPRNAISLIIVIFSLGLFSLSVFLAFQSKLTLEFKFGLLALGYIFLGTYSEPQVNIFSLSLLLFVHKLNLEKKDIIGFINKNPFFIIGLFSIFFISISPPDFTIFKYFPVLKEFPFIILVYLRYVLLLIVYGGCLIFIRISKKEK